MPIENEPQGKYISAEGLKLHYHEFGSGYPLICIHGAGPGHRDGVTLKVTSTCFAEASSHDPL